MKFKIGDEISYCDSTDAWKGIIRGYGVVSNAFNTETMNDKSLLQQIYLIEGIFYNETKVDWFEYSVEYTDENGELVKTKN